MRVQTVCAVDRKPVCGSGKLSLPTGAGGPYTCDEDDQSDIAQVDGCDSLSVSSDSDTSHDSFLPNDSSSSCSNNTLSRSLLWQDTSISDFSDFNSADEDEADSSIQIICGNSRDAQGAPRAPPVWFEEYIPRPASLPCTRQTIRRDNKYERCSMLPSVSVPNARSLFPKIRNFINDMKMRSVSLSLVRKHGKRNQKENTKVKVKGCYIWRA